MTANDLTPAAEATYPIDHLGESTASRLAIAPAWKDPRTGALYVHRDLVQVQEPWDEEEHIGPIRAAERFGDVESWVKYVTRFGDQDEPPFLTWNARGLRAVLDYHESDGSANRCQWTADCPFVPSLQWRAWTAFASGQPINQRQTIERLEDLGEDIVEPSQADLMHLLRSLRASVNARADAELRPDGTASVSFTKDQSVKAAAGTVDLPSHITIAIPVLKGHVNEDGKPVRYKLDVRLRVSVDDNAHLVFRLSIPGAERVLEEVYADRVAAARKLLGDKLPLLRAAD